jgi:FKBP-type peptidyl-prolyl cis-trans isomerase (trigger factor)
MIDKKFNQEPIAWGAEEGEKLAIDKFKRELKLDAIIEKYKRQVDEEKIDKLVLGLAKRYRENYMNEGVDVVIQDEFERDLKLAA